MRDTQAAAAMQLGDQTAWIHDRTDIADTEKVNEPHDPGFDVDLNLREAGHERIGVAVVRIDVLGHTHQSKTGVHLRGSFRDSVNVIGQLVPVELAAERDGAGGGLRVGEAARRIAFAKYAFTPDR